MLLFHSCSLELLIPVPSVGPDVNLGSATNYLCNPYLLQIVVSSTENRMLKIHESILHIFNMLHSSIFLNVYLSSILLGSRDSV